METTRNEFIKILLEEFESFCKRESQAPTNENFLQYIVNRNLIKDITGNSFVVISKYPEALEENFGIKRFAICQLEEQVSVKESTIKVILKRFQKAFRFENRLIPKIQPKQEKK